ncbi:MAG: peptide-methionine (S)-S-oxide reductase MsrA [Ignavibacteriota bacterium]
MRYSILPLFVAVLLTGAGCSAKQEKLHAAETAEVNSDNKPLEHATFAMGCFWHSEEMFLELKGVKEALPGYSGGSKENPTYEEVGEEQTGHAESVDVTFDPAVITYEQLLTVFFTEHDPTTPNMAYPDRGPQYRSMVFYRNAEQKQQAEAYIAKLTAAHTYDKPIITEVAPFKKFYQAEDYHLRYYRKHPDQSYIAHVTKPEIEKFRKDFAALLQ